MSPRRLPLFFLIAFIVLVFGGYFLLLDSPDYPVLRSPIVTILLVSPAFAGLLLLIAPRKIKRVLPSLIVMLLIFVAFAISVIPVHAVTNTETNSVCQSSVGGANSFTVSLPETSGDALFAVLFSTSGDSISSFSDSLGSTWNKAVGLAGHINEEAWFSKSAASSATATLTVSFSAGVTAKYSMCADDWNTGTPSYTSSNKCSATAVLITSGGTTPTASGAETATTCSYTVPTTSITISGHFYSDVAGSANWQVGCHFGGGSCSGGAQTTSQAPTNFNPMNTFSPPGVSCTASSNSPLVADNAGCSAFMVNYNGAAAYINSMNWQWSLCNGCAAPAGSANTDDYDTFNVSFSVGTGIAAPCSFNNGAVVGTEATTTRALVANETYLYYAETPPFSGTTITNMSLTINGITISGSSDSRIKLTLGIYEVIPLLGFTGYVPYMQPGPFDPLTLLKSTIVTLPSRFAGLLYLSPTSLNGVHLDSARIWAISVSAQHTGITVAQTTSNVNFLNDAVITENTPPFIFSVSGNPVTVATNTPAYFYASGSCDQAILTKTIVSTLVCQSSSSICSATSTITLTTTSTVAQAQFACMTTQNLWLCFLIAAPAIALLLPAGLGVFGAMLGLGAGLTFATAFGLLPTYFLILILGGCLIAIVSKARGGGE